MDPELPTLPDLSAVASVAAAMIATVGVEQAIAVLSSQFGFDITFTALSHLPGAEGGRGMWLLLTAR